MQTRNPLTITIGAAIAAAIAAPAALADTILYTSSNESTGNSVIEIVQDDDGHLAIVAEYPTGGTGTDGGLGNQGAIAFDDEFLYVVNAGSDSISSFRIRADGLQYVDTVDAFGVRPVSLSVDRGVLYVVNAGSDNIAGFTVNADGTLDHLPGSSRPLSAAGTAPAQVSFTPDGRSLIVTEKATNNLVSYPVGRDGLAGEPTVYASPGATPFGFDFTRGRKLLVSEAAGGGAGLSSVSAWRYLPQSSLRVTDAAVPTLETAACWVAVTPNGRFAYTTNTGSGNLSAYRVRGSRLQLVDADLSADGLAASAGAGSAPIDLAITPDGAFLSTLNVGTDTITSFRIGRDGDLELVAELTGLPDRATGLVAR
jgi:6-phosphogluconolactonase (cycloisomerase 2 family)